MLEGVEGRRQHACLVAIEIGLCAREEVGVVAALAQLHEQRLHLLPCVVALFILPQPAETHQCVSQAKLHMREVSCATQCLVNKHEVICARNDALRYSKCTEDM